MLDGLDELRAELRPLLVAALRAAFSRAGGQLQVVLTSRPYALADASALTGFSKRRILDLDDEQRQTFLRRYHRRLFEPIPARAEAESARLMSAMAAHRSLYNLGRTPLMLLGVAVVHYREGRLPHGRDEVFRALTNAVLELRFPTEEARRRQTERLMSIALAMHERSERDVALPVLRDLVGQALAAETGDQPGRQQTQDATDQLLGVCGLIEADEHSARFIHLGFQEYLTATALAFRLHGDYSPAMVSDRYLDDEWWRETMAMLVSQLSRGVTGYEGVKLWRALLDRRDDGTAPVARLAQLAESLQEIDPQRRDDLGAETQQLVSAIVGIIEDQSQPGELHDRIAAAEALSRLGDPRCSALEPAMVDIGNGLEVGVYPITVAQYRYFVEAGGYDPDGFGHNWLAGWHTALGGDPSRHAPARWSEQLWTPSRPVVGVSWYEVAAYCAWLTDRAGGDWEYRLPGEQEWQLAAGGAANNDRYPWGDHDPGTGATARANYHNLGMRDRAPTPVGLFPTGAADWGEAGKLLDIAGNVWEWCSDEHSSSDKPGSGGPVRPLRGGCYWNDASALAVSYRSGRHAAGWGDYLGFRVVRCRCAAAPD
jgi:formylglycine-generating enzyme required for sulfatase activity